MSQEAGSGHVCVTWKRPGKTHTRWPHGYEQGRAGAGDSGQAASVLPFH